MNVFWGEKEQDQNKARTWKRALKCPVDSPKINQCKKPPTGIPNFEWRAAAAYSPLPLRARQWSDPVDAQQRRAPPPRTPKKCNARKTEKLALAPFLTRKRKHPQQHADESTHLGKSISAHSSTGQIRDNIQQVL